MGWVSLYSGGKDSAYALHRALAAGRDVDRLLTVHPSEDSYFYHAPLTDVTRLAAESIGLPLIDVDPGDLGAAAATDATVQGDAEIEPLETELASLTEVTGVVAGAIESEYQATRLQGVCDRLDIELATPLWGADPVALLEEMVDAGFEILVVQVAAAGLDEDWLGRTIDADTIPALQGLNEEYGVHLLGEGGEFETIVTDGPHMDRALELEYTTVWDGVRGHLEIEDARLA
ncbi:MAG: diphthine--ammonia ligase [Halobacteriaceae archaeon]